MHTEGGGSLSVAMIPILWRKKRVFRDVEKKGGYNPEDI